MLNEQIKNRIKSFTWRLGSLAFVTAGAYVLSVGDVFNLDYKTLVNLTAIAVLGLAVGEVTKFLNKK